MYDVVVIGAGCVGAMTIRELTKYNLKACILEKENDVSLGATRANSAIVHAGFDAEPGTLKAKLNVRGAELFRTVTKELGVKFINNGSLVIGFDEKDKEHLELLFDRGVKNGVEVKMLDEKEVHSLEPNLTKEVKYALYAPYGAITCPYELTIAAVGNAMDNGADLKLNFKVVDIKEENGIYKITAEDGREVEAKVVINAAGVYSDKIAGLVGDTSFTVIPRRGEYILLDKVNGDIVKNTIFRTPSNMGKGILVSPTVDGNLITGPTSFNIDDKDDNSTTDEGFSLVIKQSQENVNGVNFRNTIRSFCGVRAVGSTGDFILTSPKKGFINAAGIESPGLSASPAIAEYIVEMVKEVMPLTKNESFNPIRKPMHFFKEASIEEKNEIIKKDKSFGKIICRCETVTEGEILEAIRSNPKPTDLDGVKRRTRAQMGRCQGGFCMPYIVNLLSKELNIPVTEVTKSGKGSYVNISKTKGDK